MCPHKLFEKKNVKQELFNAHFAEANHNGEEDWEVRSFDQTNNVEDLRKRESFWQLELETFLPMSGKWLYFDIYRSSLFVILIHNIY